LDVWETQGPWSPKKIANPAYFLDETPLTNIGKVGGVAIEIWTMDNNYYFSNILIDNDPAVAAEARSTYWEPKKSLEVSAPPPLLRRVAPLPEPLTKSLEMDTPPPFLSSHLIYRYCQI